MDQFELYYGANKSPKLSPTKLIKHIENWEEDIAIFFYAYWCPHCKQFSPYWNEIAKYQEKQEVKNIKYYSFDCEESKIHSEICDVISITQYPTIIYFGYGSYYQNHMISNLFFGKQTPVNRLVKYKADYDPDIIKDWTNMMSGISRSHQLWDSIAKKLGFRTKKDKELEAKVKTLEELVEVLQNSNNQLLGQEKTSKDFNQNEGKYQGIDHNGYKDTNLEDIPLTELENLLNNLSEGNTEALDEALGPIESNQYNTKDPFVILFKNNYNLETQLPLLSCVVDFTADYCALPKASNEEFCNILVECASEGFESSKCRPKKSPFKNKEGLEKVQTCLRTNVKAVYEEQLGQMDVSYPSPSDVSTEERPLSESTLYEDLYSGIPESLGEEEGALFIEKQENSNNASFDENISRNNNLAYDIDLDEDIASATTTGGI